jgi:hypothetical protein
MEQIGLVRRKRMSNDQRRVSVSLTPRSRALATRMAPLIEGVYREIEQVLGAEFSRQLHRTLDAVVEKLKASGWGPSTAARDAERCSQIRAAKLRSIHFRCSIK